MPPEIRDTCAKRVRGRVVGSRARQRRGRRREPPEPLWRRPAGAHRGCRALTSMMSSCSASHPGRSCLHACLMAGWSSFGGKALSICRSECGGVASGAAPIVGLQYSISAVDKFMRKRPALRHEKTCKRRTQHEAPSSRSDSQRHFHLCVLEHRNMDVTTDAAAAPAVEDALTCAICLCVSIRPTTTSCGHTFCRRCLRAALTVPSGQRRCPTCRHQLHAPGAQMNQMQRDSPGGLHRAPAP
jgi:hypothetical protein